MTTVNDSANQVLGTIEWLVIKLITYGLLGLVLAAVAAKYGFRVPVLPQVNETALAWLCGAWWLLRGGKL